jgi:hypothetical protein
MPMRLPFAVAFIVVVTLASPLAQAAMFKCTSPDGTVAFQAVPCQGGAKQEVADVRPAGGGTTARLATTGASVDGAGRVLIANDGQQRAVADREETQRRDRCRSYRDAIDRQSAALDSGSESAKQKAAREINIQERKAQQDRC